MGLDSVVVLISFPAQRKGGDCGPVRRALPRIYLRLGQGAPFPLLIPGAFVVIPVAFVVIPGTFVGPLRRALHLGWPTLRGGGHPVSTQSGLNPLPRVTVPHENTLGAIWLGEAAAS